MVEQKEQNTKKYIVCNSTYGKSSKTQLIYGDRRKWLGDRGWTGKGYMGTFWSNTIILFVLDVARWMYKLSRFIAQDI